MLVWLVVPWLELYCKGASSFVNLFLHSILFCYNIYKILILLNPSYEGGNPLTVAVADDQQYGSVPQLQYQHLYLVGGAGFFTSKK